MPSKTRPKRKSDPVSDKELADSLGATLRELRKSRGLTLQELANECGLSQPFLSQLENGKAVPSLAALASVARSLGTTAHGLLAPRRDREVSSVRAEAGGHFELFEGATVRFLGDGASNALEPNEVSVAAGARSPHVAHAGEEWVYVLEGEVSVAVEGEDVVELGPGDSCTYTATLPHSVGAMPSGPARFLIVSSPPSY